MAVWSRGRTTRTEARTEPCPRCSANPHMPCTDPEGYRRDANHIERVNRYSERYPVVKGQAPEREPKPELLRAWERF